MTPLVLEQQPARVGKQNDDPGGLSAGPPQHVRSAGAAPGSSRHFPSQVPLRRCIIKTERTEQAARSRDVPSPARAPADDREALLYRVDVEYDDRVHMHADQAPRLQAAYLKQSG